jgi:putative ABC transport system substrate-binding protein
VYAKRRAAVRAAGVALLAMSLRASAQRSLARIGLLTVGPNPREAAFLQGLRELGYEEGRTIRIERRSVEGDFARLPELAAELVGSRPDVIAVTTSAAAQAAKQATATIPIVMIGSSDPVAGGLVASLARPGGNVTGVSTQGPVASRKLLELVRQIRPGTTRIAALWDPVNAISQQLRLGEMLIAAARMNLFVRIVEMRTRDDLERAFAAFRADPPEFVLTGADTFTLANAQRLAELALASRLPAISTGRTLAEAGFLASYGADVNAVARRAATYVHRILKGAKPAELPVELSSKFELVINLRTANALEMSLPATLLARADAVLR